MKVIVAAVGAPRDPALAAAIREYESRAARYWPLEVREARGESGRGASAAQVREREGERLLALLPAGGSVLACDAGGTEMTSERFAEWLQREREGARDVAFVIGGAFGLSAAVKQRAQRRLALAPWTLPHELARLVLAEQLYRAGTIRRGEPYHK
ncbi:MAG TPA: 23S rRNA (pseudouridine(1915)-N(3))-methyltransferase RlmH [Gemmatimonadaceae bacterium]|nr:23S rRNA (pseudouridine(1915)-N(3))-methyltransferase RlmH [Gemmatimonadaceae bacterium]